MFWAIFIIYVMIDIMGVYFEFDVTIEQLVARGVKYAYKMIKDKNRNNEYDKYQAKHYRKVEKEAEVA